MATRVKDQRRRLKKLNLVSLNRQARAAQAGEPFIRDCTGKRRYATVEEAKEAGVRIKKKDSKANVRVYRCTNCKQWHMSGHKIRRAKK